MTSRTRPSAESIAGMSARNRNAFNDGLDAIVAQRERDRASCIKSKPAPRQSRAKKPAGPRISESAEQQKVVQWWGMYCGTVGLDERLLMASQSGAVLAGDAKHRAIQVARLKREGWRPGVPDLFLALPMATDQHGRVTLFNGCWIELKALDGCASVVQIEYVTLLRKVGYNAVISHGADEAIRAIKAYCERAKS